MYNSELDSNYLHCLNLMERILTDVNPLEHFNYFISYYLNVKIDFMKL